MTAPAPSLGRLLEVSSLNTCFVSGGKRTRVVKDVAFHVAPGTITGIVGESGSGKSVSARSALGLIRYPGIIESGAARFQSAQGAIDLLSCSPRKRREILGSEIGYVLQNPFGALNPVLRIGGQFRRVLRASIAFREHAAGAVDRVAREALTQVGIADPDRVLSGYAHQLSGGMAQRVVIAFALARKPRLIIADEPTTALDLTVQRQILDLLAARAAELGTSVLLITHDLGIVAHYCADAFVFYRGEVVEHGTVDDLFRRTRHSYTKQLIAASGGRAASNVAPAAEADLCPC